METNTKEKYVVRGELALLIVVIINSLGVVNRLNPAQLFESELNFVAE